MLVHFENKYGEENQHGKSIIINRYIKYITACSFLRKQFNITCKSITLLIKRNSRTKQSDSIFETNMGNVFCLLWNFNVHSHHLICYLLYKLTHVRRICKICLLQSTNNVLSEATILVRSSQQKWSIKSLFLKISKYSQENTNVLWSLFLTKLQDWSPATLFKIDPNIDLPCEYCEILKSTYVEDLRTATSAFFKSIF